MGSQFKGRVEDARLTTGGGRYAADVSLPDQVYAAFHRAPVAHAEVRGVDVSAAKTMPGVLLAMNGADMAALNWVKSPAPPLKNRDGSTMVIPDWPALATDRVRHVGEPVAIIIAETPAQAADAAEAVVFEYDELPAITETRFQENPSVQLWPQAKDNVALDFAAGSIEATDAAFAQATHVVSAEVINQRLVVATMEPRAAIAHYVAADDRFDLYTCSQGATMLAQMMAAKMNLTVDKIRVLTHDTGGGFGMKTHNYPEYAAMLEASRRVGRPVKWNSSRSEAFVSDTQARDTLLQGELALDAEGRFLGLRMRSVINLGAYLSSHAAATATSNLIACGVNTYLTGAIDVQAKCIFTNKVPIAPYRGAGRPEAILIVERLVDLAAQKLGMDPAEIRRKNLIPTEAMPYKAPNNFTYDSGNFPETFARAMKRADYAGFPARRAEAEKRGKLRGIGVACYLEISNSAPFEEMRLDVGADGVVVMRTGLHSNGQGHATLFPQLCAEELGIPATGVVLPLEGDSHLVPGGLGSFGSRSMTVGGTLAITTAKLLKQKACELGAQLLQATPEQVEWQAGRVALKGSDRSLSLADIARDAGPVMIKDTTKGATSFPNGCMVCEIEADPRTGVAKFVSMVAVDDIGRVVDHTMAEGQVYGGIAMGLGQVLVERAVYDPETGQLLTGSFMDYALPRADDLIDYNTEMLEVPCTTNPMGTKGAGEAGTTGALAAGYNAIMNLLAHAGHKGEFEMPATAPRLWEALNNIKKEKAA
jgi:carbon-monoxide dehydrogenase large subunit